MRALKEPRFSYTRPGETIYLTAGQPFLVLSPDIGSSLTIFIANPSIAAWQDTLSGYENTLDGYVRILSGDGLEKVEEAIVQLEQELEVWRNAVRGVHARHTNGTVARGEVESIIRRQEEGVAQMRGIRDGLSTQQGTASSSSDRAGQRETRAGRRCRPQPSGSGEDERGPS